MAEQILAPIPGIFYRSPAPDQPPFKVEGDSVATGDTIGLIEVMKAFFPVDAETDGRLVRFLVEDGQSVEAEDVIAEIE